MRVEQVLCRLHKLPATGQTSLGFRMIRTDKMQYLNKLLAADF
jgi:hypothetical protein